MAHLQIPFDSTLDTYRKCSLIDIEELKKFLFSEESVKIQKELHKEVQKYPVLYPNNAVHISQDEQKRLLVKKTFAAYSIRLKFKELYDEPYFLLSSARVIDQLDKCIAVQAGIAFGMFPTSVLYLGTDRHLQLYEESCSGKILGAFCLTEIGHGSNTKQMKTTATYDKNSKEFILHTPDFEAAKCWAGNIGKIATHAIVYAQLITPDNTSHGLHAFVVPIRHHKTFIPFPGIIVADIGEKIGLFGVDNGILIFNQYRIPKTNLLNKIGDVTDEGKYLINIKDIKQQYSNSFKILSQGRLSIITGSCMLQVHALTIGLRYAAVRRQFGPKPERECPIIEYQSLQYRLVPYLACTYTAILFINSFNRHRSSFTENDDDLQMEIHAILCSGKPYFSFIARDTIQECREACGGLGYISVSGIGSIRNDNDANVTFEGDNNVLLQQTSNWLLKYWNLVVSKKPVTTPLASLEFLNNASDILQLHFAVTSIEEFYKPERIYKYFQWLVCYLLKQSHAKCSYLESLNKSSFSIKNNSQVYYLRNLSIAYLESFVLSKVMDLIQSSTNMDNKNVLNKLISLYGLWSLQKHIPFFYQGKYTDNPLFCKYLEDSILFLCKDIKNDVVKLIDTIAPFDDALKSILAHPDGQVYSKLLGVVAQVNSTHTESISFKNIISKL